MKIQKSFDTTEVGKKVRQLRKARSMRQDELGRILGDRVTGKPLSRGQVSNLETGKRNFNIYQIKTLADYFGISLETLGIKSEEIEINDLLIRAKLIFENKTISFEEKQELSEELLKLYIYTKEQLKLET